MVVEYPFVKGIEGFPENRRHWDLRGPQKLGLYSALATPFRLATFPRLAQS